MKGKFISINCYIVIESLRKDETKTGLGIFNDCLRWRVEEIGAHAAYYEVNSKENFHTAMKHIENYVREGMIPYIHFEIHGGKNGFQLNNGEWVLWEELYNFLVPLNIILKNTLIISLATCFGANIFGIMSPLKRAPFYAFIAPIYEEKSGDLEVDFLEYFNRLMTENEFNSALSYMFRSNPAIHYLFYSSEMLFDDLKHFIPNDHPDQKFKELFSQVKTNRKYNRAETRKRLREGIKNRKKLISRFRDFFLMKDL